MIWFRPDEVDAMARRYRAGEPLETIARSLGVGRSTVRRRLAARGVALRGRSEAASKLGRREVDALARRYLAGEPLEAIARSAGVTAPTVSLRLRALGVAIRAVGRPRARPEASCSDARSCEVTRCV